MIEVAEIAGIVVAIVGGALVLVAWWWKRVEEAIPAVVAEVIELIGEEPRG